MRGRTLLIAAAVSAASCAEEPEAGPARPEAAPAREDAGAAPAPHAADDDSGSEEEARAHDEELDALLDFEEARRASANFRELPRAGGGLGPDPYDLRRLPESERMVGLLRGAARVVLLDAGAREIFRLPAPRTPTGLAVTGEGDVLVAGDASSEIAWLRPVRAAGEVVALRRAGTLVIEGALGVRDLAVRGDRLYLARSVAGVLEVAELARGPGEALRIASRRRIGRCRGPIQTALVGKRWLASCLLDRSLLVYRLDERGAVRGRPIRIQHDGPILSFAAAATDRGLFVAAAGVEDRPLDRSDGAFGYIDSFVYLYRLEGGDARRIAEHNLSALGVITPKHLELRGARGGVELTALGYGGDRAAVLSWEDGALAGDPEVASIEVPAGANRAARGEGGLVIADPLLDAWILLEGTSWRAVYAPGAEARSVESRIGEALFFTRLMAPWNQTEGERSRFTCETCHFEGTVDGRTHWTGRGEVHASTRPLLSLLSDRPYFSRALDPTMAKMVHNEFRVANKKSGRDPWFELEAARFPWLALWEGVPERLGPRLLRRSLMTFLMDFNHRPNPAAAALEAFGERERAGARVFRARCEPCHQARLVSDLPETRLPPEAWEEEVLHPAGAITWAKAEYEKTGVEPYVHERGARVPPLRRLYLKRPYFTNGSAETLAEVLERAAWAGGRFYHAGAPAGSGRLDEGEREALLAFLRLL